MVFNKMSDFGEREKSDQRKPCSETYFFPPFTMLQYTTLTPKHHSPKKNGWKYLTRSHGHNLRLEHQSKPQTTGIPYNGKQKIWKGRAGAMKKFIFFYIFEDYLITLQQMWALGNGNRWWAGMPNSSWRKNERSATSAWAELCINARKHGLFFIYFLGLKLILAEIPD